VFGKVKAIVLARNQARRLMNAVFVAWHCATEDLRRDASAQEAREQLERMRQQKLAVVDRHFNMFGMTMAADCFVSWRGLCEIARLAQSMKSSAMATSLRRIADIDAGLKFEAMSAFTRAIAEWKSERLLHVTEVARIHMQKARQRALKALEKALFHTDEALKGSAYGWWRDAVQHEKLDRRRKEVVADWGGRSTTSSERAVLVATCRAWAVLTQQETLERRLRERQLRCADLGRKAFLRLRIELQCRRVWDCWVLRSNLRGASGW